MNHPKTPITLPCRRCVLCMRYKPVISGCQNSTWQGRKGVRKPFICAQCMAKREAA